MVLIRWQSHHSKLGFHRFYYAGNVEISKGIIRPRLCRHKLRRLSQTARAEMPEMSAAAVP
jgi:hypothetical protein